MYGLISSKQECRCWEENDKEKEKFTASYEITHDAWDLLTVDRNVSTCVNAEKRRRKNSSRAKNGEKPVFYWGQYQMKKKTISQTAPHRRDKCIVVKHLILSGDLLDSLNQETDPEIADISSHSWTGRASNAYLILFLGMNWRMPESVWSLQICHLPWMN